MNLITAKRYVDILHIFYVYVKGQRKEQERRRNKMRIYYAREEMTKEGKEMG